MNKVKKQIQKLILLCLMAVFIVLSFSGCIYPHKDAVEYLKNFQRTTDIAVTDSFEVFCFDNKSLNIRKNFKENVVKRIEFVDKNSIYIFSHSNETEKYLIYKTDYELKEKSVVCEFSDSAHESQLLNSDLLFYRLDNNYYTYQISTGTTEAVEEDFVEKYKETISRYTVSKKIKLFEGMRYTIKDSVTGTEKVVTKKHFHNVEPARYLSDKKSFSLDKIYAVGENIYIIGETNGCAIIFKYDFEKDSISYYSWIDTSALISEPRDYYFFT